MSRFTSQLAATLAVESGAVDYQAAPLFVEPAQSPPAASLSRIVTATLRPIDSQWAINIAQVGPQDVIFRDRRCLMKESPAWLTIQVGDDEPQSLLVVLPDGARGEPNEIVRYCIVNCEPEKKTNEPSRDVQSAT